jgi:hypothetical protein
VNLAYRWFCGLSIEDKIPDHSAFSRIRHERFREGIGTENHCMHGKGAIVEEVLDWRPSDYFTVSTLLPIPGAPKIMMTHAFQDRTNGATHIEMRVAKPKPKDQAFVDQAGAKFKENITKAIENLRLMLEEQQQTSLSLIDDPPLIASSARFLTEPVKSSAS